jgi:ketosteroid isomerase-like protein
VSQENVELHRRAIAVFNERDIEAMLAFASPSIEFHSVFAAAIGGIYHGHDGMRMWQRDMKDAWGDEIRLEPEAYYDLGEHTLAFYVVHGRGRHSGAEVAMPVAMVARWQDGLVVHMAVYTDRDAALRELHLSEGELEPIDP